MKILKICDSFHTTGMCSKVTALMRRNGTRYVHLSLIFFAPYLFILFLNLWLTSFHKGLRDHRRGPLSAKTEKREQRQRIFVRFKPRFLLKLLDGHRTRDRPCEQMPDLQPAYWAEEPRDWEDCSDFQSNDVTQDEDVKRNRLFQCIRYTSI